MIHCSHNFFVLETANTSYIFRITESGHPEHLYYGRKWKNGMCSSDLADSIYSCLIQKSAFIPANTNAYSKEYGNLTLEDIRLEMSSFGKGDIREPFVEIVHADGSYTSDFLYESYELTKGKEEGILPGSYDETGEVEHLTVSFIDKQYSMKMELHYYVYEKCDVITRKTVLINESEESADVKRLMSLQLDLDRKGYVLTTFHGGWAKEMQRSDTVVNAGKHVNASYTGTTSSRANSFIMLADAKTTETQGECMGFHLIYSGNHYEAVEVSSFDKTRVITGMNPQSFCYRLEKGERLEAPEAVMTYAKDGYHRMSLNLHEFVREHIVRGVWKHKERPILINSWEAAYFDINEKKLLQLAKAAKDVGIELFVMDDGWFGTRDDDTQSLGDWVVNEKKLPGGLKGLCDKINALGLEFGIWVEPEMVNVKSRLYEQHPDWVLGIPGKPHSEGRNQRILDLCNPAVQDYVVESMTKVFASANISYVKWDMNRTFTDCYSEYLPPERQQEVVYRYYLGLYRCMKELTKRFPNILFEGCAAGGNRFDLGILCYFPQIWASDNTDALCRVTMQHNYSYGYPMSVVSAHVSGCPNHQTLRRTPLETRFHVAAFGICGYECNLKDLPGEELKAIRAQVALYKKWRRVLQFGDFHRGRALQAGNLYAGSYGTATNGGNGATDGDALTEWTCVSKDKKRAVGFIMQALVQPNATAACYYPSGLDEQKLYHFYNRELKYSIKEFGDLINTVSPVHIRQDSLVQDVVSKFVKMDGEKEELYAYGDMLMYGGVHLKQAFGATGYNEQVRFFQDFASRMYFMEEAE